MTIRTGFRVVPLLVLLVSCGADGAAAPADALGERSVAYLDLSAASDAWPDMSVRILERSRPASAADPGWASVGAEGATLRETGDYEGAGGAPRPALVVDREKLCVLRIPVSDGVTGVDRLRLELGVESATDVLALVVTAAQEQVASEILSIDGSGTVEFVELPLVRPLRDDEEVQGVSVHVRNRGGESAVFGLDLLDLPASLRVPPPHEGWVRVQRGGEALLAKGLLPGVELAGEVVAPPVAELELEVALPPGVADARGASVVCEVRHGARKLAEAQAALTSGWSTIRVPLDLAGRARDGSMLLSIRVTTDSAEGALVGRPRLVRSRDAARGGEPRTVVLLTSDTHRADHVGYMPLGVGVRTPTIDRLAAQGAVFLDATSTSPITAPSHASMFTGLPVRDTGVYHNLTVLSGRAKTLAERFRSAGFRTFAAVSARHLMPSRSGFGQGFERFDGPTIELARDGSVTVDAALRMLASADGHDVFIWLHAFDAHVPYRPHDGCTELYYEGDPYSERLAELAPKATATWNPRIRDLQYVLACYRGEVTYLDRQLGRLLREAPRTERGVLAFTADHGESLGQNGSYWTHRPLYTSSLRVPLVIKGGALAPGTVVVDPVCNSDVGRTLLELAGVESASRFPGRSLAELSPDEDPGPVPRHAVAGGGEAAGIFFDGWYLVLMLDEVPWGGREGAERHAVQLYRLAQDPDCEVDLAAERPDVAARLRRGLVRWLTDTPPSGTLAGAPPTDPGAAADIAALGYAVDRASKRDAALIDPGCDCENCRAYE